MLFSWNPPENTPEPEPSVDESAAAAPLPSMTEMCVVPVSGACRGRAAVPRQEPGDEHHGERRTGPRQRLEVVDRREPLHDDATAARRRRARQDRVPENDASSGARSSTR